MRYKYQLVTLASIRNTSIVIAARESITLDGHHTAKREARAIMHFEFELIRIASRLSKLGDKTSTELSCALV